MSIFLLWEKYFFTEVKIRGSDECDLLSLIACKEFDITNILQNFKILMHKELIKLAFDSYNESKNIAKLFQQKLRVISCDHFEESDINEDVIFK
ncbi:Hypothetical predicted protein [Octopus vulgaris]|uniref:Uncharacterized protein n=1 Tax=Octopus vulgaris TaxID=6645 RepID=A0AA36AUD6_OCTVU|nr:Hypothetical predicted protein [Octopus vulgaris]